MFNANNYVLPVVTDLNKREKELLDKIAILEEKKGTVS
jgi:hypothetical protein